MRLVVAIVITIGVLAPSRAFAQSAPPVQRDVLAELLVEVRGLRQAMERAATVGARIQLLVARVQMQEERIAESSRRLVAVRDEIRKLDSGLASLMDQARVAEKESNSEMTEFFKRQVASVEVRRQAIANEESLLLQQVSADQGRWNDVNAQLDDIERSLATPAPRKQ